MLIKIIFDPHWVFFQEFHYIQEIMNIMLLHPSSPPQKKIANTEILKEECGI